MNKLSYLFVLFVILVTGGCAGSARSQRTTLENLQAQFPPVEAVELLPLEEVTVPDRESADPATSRAQRLTTGQAATFDGLLLSDSAAAYVVSEYAAIQSRYGAALIQQRERDFARLLRDTEVLRLRINGDRERFLISFQSQDTYIRELESVALQDNTVMDVLVITGAGAIGVVLGIIVGFFLAN